MNEDYVSFEVARLLKEKDFDWYCRAYYDYNNSGLSYLNDISNTYDVYAAPTLYMAQKWLREEKSIHILIDVHAGEYFAVLWKTNGTFIKSLALKGPNINHDWDNYEQALQAGILEALKLI